ncbi:MAG: diguanylate cyclase [Candidatus Manganitrophaceae bacterium]
MTVPRRIALVGKKASFIETLELRLHGQGYQVVTLTKPAAAIGEIYSDPVDLVIIDFPSPDSEIESVLRGLKEETSFSTIPVIGLIGEGEEGKIDWVRFPFDDVVPHPIRYSELFSRIPLAFERIERIVDRNPLTQLPGNPSIQRAIERVLGKAMAVCYLDINQFKPYNDRFGFARGDEVIRMVARVVSNAVKESGGRGFTGHIGGDDFVFIVPMERAEWVCKAILNRFELVTAVLFEEEERERGYYFAKDRKGQEQKIPLLGVVIAVVPASNPGMDHFGKIAATAAELKTFAKKSGENRYVIDRRRG